MLERLPALETLSLRGNGLTQLPPALWRLAKLRELDLSDNLLPLLPPDIAQLRSLEARSNRRASATLHLVTPVNIETTS